jgi:hypothetical protein
MRMALLAPDMGSAPMQYAYAVKDDLLDRACPAAAVPSGNYPMEDLRIGVTKYRFRRLVVGRAYPISPGRFEFVVDTLAPHVIGHGDTPRLALQDWSEQVHVLYQQLLAMRPFEMGDRDHARWRALESLIDSADFRRLTPVRMRQLGHVKYSGRQYPFAICWADGKQERVTFDMMPSEFPSFRPGQWIEAICERDPVTGQLITVTHVERIAELRMMSPEQQEQYWESLPTSDSLPESDVDWTRS